MVDDKTKQPTCPFCSKVFTLNHHLKDHIRIHTGERPYVCHICDATFPKLSAKNRHVQTIHEKRRPFECDVCGKTFAQKCNLTKHVLVHLKQKPHNCKTCGKGFADQSNLKKHQAVHTNIKPFVCDKCNARYKRKDQLRQHLNSKHLETIPEVRTRTNTHSYPCPYAPARIPKSLDPQGSPLILKPQRMTSKLFVNRKFPRVS